MAGNCKRGQCVLSSGYRIWSVPDPGYRLQGACTCPVPVRYLYPMRRTGGGGGTKPTPGGPTKVGPVDPWDPVYCPQGIAYGLCLTHTFCPRGACQQAGTVNGYGKRVLQAG